METVNFLAAAAEYLDSRKFMCQTSFPIPGIGQAVELFAVKTGRSFGPFFPYEDCLFFHDFSRLPKDREGLARVHEAERQFVNARYKLPKMLRYKVPNIVTVLIASAGFSPEVSEYASENTIDPIGGERHQVILVDLGRNNSV